MQAGHWPQTEEAQNNLKHCRKLDKMRNHNFKKKTQLAHKLGMFQGSLGRVKKNKRTQKMSFGFRVLTISENSTVSMGGVRAEANITRDGEGGIGCLDLPHLSTYIGDK